MVWLETVPVTRNKLLNQISHGKKIKFLFSDQPTRVVTAQVPWLQPNQRTGIYPLTTTGNRTV